MAVEWSGAGAHAGWLKKFGGWHSVLFGRHPVPLLPPFDRLRAVSEVERRLRDQGRLFTCHSERSEESLSFSAQGKLREESLGIASSVRRDPSPAPRDQDDKLCASCRLKKPAGH